VADLCEGVPPHSTLAKEFRLAQPSKGGRRLPRRGPLSPQRQDSKKRAAPPVKRWSPDVAPGSHGRGRPTSLYGVQWATGQPVPLGRRRGLPTPPDTSNSGYGDVRRVET